MARLPRSTLPGVPHRVLQSGYGGQVVFNKDPDFRHYLAILRECVERDAIDIWAYCLMPDSVHFVCVPGVEGALAHGLNAIHMRYAQYLHRNNGVTGQLWQARFRSCMLDGRSVFEEVRFIENGPVRSGLVERAEDYRWSSARQHVLREEDPLLRNGGFLNREIRDWRAYLAEIGDEAILDRTYRCLRTGRPAGEAEWVRKLESIMGRCLMALPRGRPRKAPVVPNT